MLLKQKQNLSKIILTIFMVFAGTTFYITRDLINYVDPVAIALYRFSFAGLILGVFLKFKNVKLTQNWTSGAFSGFFLWLFFIFQNLGLEITTASNSSFLTGLFVVFVPIISAFLKSEKFSKVKALELFISILGLWVITGGLREINFGDVLSILAAIVYAVYNSVVDLQVRKHKLNALVNAFQQFVSISLFSILLVLFQGRGLEVSGTYALGLLAYLIIIPTLGTFTVINITQKYLLPFTLSLILTLSTLFGAIFAWTLGGEVVTTNGIIGGLLILLAVLISPLLSLLKHRTLTQK